MRVSARFFGSQVVSLLGVIVLVVGSANAQGFDLLVTGFFSDNILRYDGETGSFVDQFASGSVPNPGDIILGPDGDVYVSLNAGPGVVRFDAQAGGEWELFATDPDGPWGLAFGPDDHLYVSDFLTDVVRRFDGATGAPIDTFAAGGGMDKPRGIAFGPDGDLYVASEGPIDSVLRFDGDSGGFVGVFASLPGTPTGLAFGPNGDLFVSSSGSDDSVHRYDSKTGTLLDVYQAPGALDGPHGLVFGPDDNLYVGGANSDNVVRFHGETGEFLGVFAQGGGLEGPVFAVFVPKPECFLVVGDGPGSATFFEISHLFQTQLDAVEDSYAVLMEDIPEFVLPGPELAALPAGASLAGTGSGGGPAPETDIPAWMWDGHFTVQILMWNPAVFPQTPEQVSYGLRVYVSPDGTVSTRPFGTGTGIDVWAETDVNAEGQSVVRFPFSIPGI